MVFFAFRLSTAGGLGQGIRSAGVIWQVSPAGAIYRGVGDRGTGCDRNHPGAASRERHDQARGNPKHGGMVWCVTQHPTWPGTSTLHGLGRGHSPGHPEHWECRAPRQGTGALPSLFSYFSSWGSEYAAHSYSFPQVETLVSGGGLPCLGIQTWTLGSSRQNFIASRDKKMTLTRN